MRHLITLTLAGLLCGSIAHADVRSEEKSQVKFEGGLGRMLNLFGGKAAREGIVSSVTVKGDRKATATGDNMQIVDLREEKIYDIDVKDKSYRVTTFAEIKKQMEDARKKAEAQASRESGSSSSSGEPQKQVEVDFDLKESGQKRAINGFDAREVIMTVAVREKGKTLAESGGMVLTSNIWMAPAIVAMQEVAAFDRRYAEKMFGPTMIDARQMAAAVAM